MDIDTYRNKWWIMVAVSLTLFMGAVDGTIVNVALPTLAAEFNASFATVQWVVLAFLLGLSVLLLSVRRLADMVGKKRLFATGLVIFVIGSVLCGFAPSIYALIAARLLQASGAAMTIALGVAIVTETWPPRRPVGGCWAWAATGPARPIVVHLKLSVGRASLLRMLTLFVGMCSNHRLLCRT